MCVCARVSAYTCMATAMVVFSGEVADTSNFWIQFTTDNNISIYYTCAHHCTFKNTCVSAASVRMCVHTCMCTCVCRCSQACVCVCVWVWNFVLARPVANLFQCVNMCMCCVHALAHEVAHRWETHSESFALIIHEAVFRLVLNLCWVSCTGCY